ncbi:hypothetical protein BGZ94_003726 [Podila epigama]|nr:hypothetical protein BGZ94_003726 [Podila epigama]
MCRLDCEAQATNVTDQIQVIINEINLVLAVAQEGSWTFKIGNDVTDVGLPPIVRILNEMKENIAKVKENPEALALISGQLYKTVNGTKSVLSRLSQAFKEDKKPILTPSVMEMETLLPKIDALIECSGGNSSDCSGIDRLYHEFIEAGIARMQTLAVPPRDKAIADIITDVRKFTGDIEQIYTSGNITKLNEIGVTINVLISKVTANKTLYGDIADILELIYAGAAESLRCHGLNVTVFADKCSAYGQRTNGYLSQVIQFFNNIIRMVPFLGPLAAAIIDGLDQAIQDILNAGGSAIGGILGLIMELLKLLNVVAPAEYREQIQAWILNILDIRRISGDCGGMERDCYGAWTLIRIILNTIPNLLGKCENIIQTPLACSVGDTLRGIIKAVTDAGKGLTGAIVNSIASALRLINGAICLVLQPLCQLIEFLIASLEDIAQCLVDLKNDTSATASLVSDRTTLTLLD